MSVGDLTWPNSVEWRDSSGSGKLHMKHLLILFTVTLAIGCAGKKSSTEPANTTAEPTLEISRDPTILITQRDKWDQMTLQGIKVGDPESSIPPGKISERTKNNWIVMRNANRFRIADGTITTVGVWQNSLLSKLGVNVQEDVEKVFGKPKEYVRITTSLHLYTYQDGHVHVVWNQTEKRLNAVNLIR